MKQGTNKKTQKYQKRNFSVISQIFLLFLVGVQNFVFLTTWPKKRAPQNTITIGVSARIFWKSDMRHETALVGPKKPKPEIPANILFGPFSFLSTTKT